MPSVEQVSTDIVNLALNHCGVSKPVASLIAEKSLEAQLVRTFYDISRQKTLQQFPWYFAKKTVAPALITQWPTYEWQYAYQYPSDALRIVRFMSWRLTNDTRQSRVEFTVGQPVSINLSAAVPPPTAAYPQSSGLWIYTNWPGQNNAMPTAIEYIFDNQNVGQWSPSFVLALSLKLATYLVQTVTTGDPAALKDKINMEYKETMAQAQADLLNEEQRPEEPQSEFIRARDGDVFGYSGMNWVAQQAGFSIE
jgi:hypothetical protein